MNDQELLLEVVIRMVRYAEELKIAKRQVVILQEGGNSAYESYAKAADALVEVQQRLEVEESAHLDTKDELSAELKLAEQRFDLLEQKSHGYETTLKLIADRRGGFPDTILASKETLARDILDAMGVSYE